MLLRLRQQGLVFSHGLLSTCLVLFLAVVASAATPDATSSPVAETAVQQPLKPEDYFGVYRSDDGAEAKLYLPGGVQAWTMSYVRPGESPMFVVMEGDPAAMRPVGLDVTVSLNGKPLKIVGDVSGLYAKGAASDKTLECFATDGGTEVAFDGETVTGDDSPDGMSASMTVSEIAQLWKRMQHSRVNVADQRLRIIPPNSDPQRVSQFARTATLSDEDKYSLEAAFSNRLSRLAEKQAFTNRERKKEDEP
ncbi:MAG TPA: hypothetical protein PLE77_14310 [Kiritimatiellia bacterium]|nr:hypothetical protein [Kiritimatiellia bacterium]